MVAYLPLESNPDVFTGLAHRLGLSPQMAFHDVLSLDDPDLLALVPRPVSALVLAFPAPGEAYQSRKNEQERHRPAYDKKGDAEAVVWFRQTIFNACGLYALLHALANGAGGHVAPDSIMSRLLDKCRPLDVQHRAQALEADHDIADAHKDAALAGVTQAPASPEDDVDHHYVCFAKSRKDGHLYELDGDLMGPVSWADLAAQDDLLDEAALVVVRDFVRRTSGDDGRFSLLALAPSSGC